LSLFQKVIVNKYLKNLSSDLIEESYKKYSVHFLDPAMAERVKALKEEQYQEGFLRDLFVNCLGYTINPYENFNLTTEFKNKTDAEKADGAILKDGNPIAVIELKSTKTKDLKTIEKQAFNYKTHQTNCKYVITSNFEKIRLYINDATEFEEFNVFQLPKDEFKYLYLCFSKENIFDDIPAIIKEKSNQHEEQISKKLYNDYSIFRNNIFQNLTKNNPQINKQILFKKSQKLLDRFLFIFFAEDKGLIPANIISKVIEDYNKLQELDHYTPLYSEFKKYFSYINKGNEKLSIAAYNGGLFQFDEILENVIIDDEILITDSLKLSNYNFDSEIDVNILGHIFEHSLTDIEKLNAEISGENLDKKQTRRKKEGVFYTPNYITKYIVENTVGTLCTDKKDQLKLNDIEVGETYFKKTKKTNSALSKKGEQLFAKLENYKEWLLSLKILDPACGSGAFLNQALNFLIDEHNFIIDLETDLRKGQYYAFDIDTAVLENNLFGVDINEESVEIAKLSLWLKTAKKGRKLTDLSEHIKCGNSLIDDPEIAGEKAFDWNKEFPEIMHNGGFDVVIGNPPYVTFALGKKQEFENKDIEYFKEKYPLSSVYKVSSYLIFIEKSLKLISNTGLLSFIVPNSLYTNYYYSKFREYIIDNYFIYSLFNLKYEVFKDVDTGGSSITVFGKNKIEKTKLLSAKNENNYQTPYIFELNQKKFKKIPDNKFLFSDNLISLWNKSFEKSIPLSSNNFKFYNGIKTGNNKKFLSNEKINERYKPVIRGRDFYKYTPLINELFVLFDPKQLWSNTNEEMYLVDEKLIFRQTSDHLVVSYDNCRNFTMDTTHILFDKSHKFNHKYLLSILNSKLLNFLYQIIVPEIGKTFSEVKGVNLKKLPVKEISKQTQFPFIKKADLMLSLNKQKQEKINKFLHRLKTNFEIEKFTNKMKAFYDYDFKTLITELKKKKIKLSFSQQDEWEEYFKNYKDAINELQKQIDKTDKEIDQMVYELYGLNEDEIEIVESG